MTDTDDRIANIARNFADMAAQIADGEEEAFAAGWGAALDGAHLTVGDALREWREAATSGPLAAGTDRDGAS